MARHAHGLKYINHVLAPIEPRLNVHYAGDDALGHRQCCKGQNVFERNVASLGCRWLPVAKPDKQG
eukprot:scaffold79077_cov18-Prasinocladus_malaysianus.AAC.1